LTTPEDEELSEVMFRCRICIVIIYASGVVHWWNSWQAEQWLNTIYVSLSYWHYS